MQDSYGLKPCKGFIDRSTDWFKEKWEKFKENKEIWWDVFWKAVPLGDVLSSMPTAAKGYKGAIDISIQNRNTNTEINKIDEQTK